MTNNTIMRTLTLTGDWQFLSDHSLIATVDVSIPPHNTSSVLFRGDTDQEVPWIPGEYHQLIRVDLATIQVKGTAGDAISIIGGTW